MAMQRLHIDISMWIVWVCFPVSVCITYIHVYVTTYSLLFEIGLFWKNGHNLLFGTLKLGTFNCVQILCSHFNKVAFFITCNVGSAIYNFACKILATSCWNKLQKATKIYKLQKVTTTRNKIFAESLQRYKKKIIV